MSFLLLLALSFHAQAHYIVVGGDILHDEFQLAGIDYDFPRDEVRSQQRELGGRFRPALREALDCFLNNSEHPESPLAIATQLAFEIMHLPESEPIPPRVLAKAKYILKSHLRLPTTHITLLHRSEVPEGGEKVCAAWIIKLKIKTLSDHLQWAIVDRNDKDRTYCYGFN